MSKDIREKKLTQYRNLMARATHPSTPPEEAKSCAELAYKFYVKYKFEDSEVNDNDNTKTANMIGTFRFDQIYMNDRAAIELCIAVCDAFGLVLFANASKTMTKFGEVTDLYVSGPDETVREAFEMYMVLVKAVTSLVVEKLRKNNLFSIMEFDSSEFHGLSLRRAKAFGLTVLSKHALITLNLNMHETYESYMFGYVRGVADAFKEQYTTSTSAQTTLAKLSNNAREHCEKFIMATFGIEKESIEQYVTKIKVRPAKSLNNKTVIDGYRDGKAVVMKDQVK